MQLRPYQKEALDSILSFEAKGVKRQLVVLPTGAGKTVIFSHLPKIKNDALPMLVIAHREELLTQAKEKIEHVNPTLRVEIEQAGNKATLEADIVVASVATIGRAGSQRLAGLEPSRFRTVVIDEAHHAAAQSYQNVLAALPDALRIGVTATPQRGDNVRLTDVFDEVVYYKTILDLIEDGFLSRLVGYRIKTDTDISSVSTVAGDYNEGELSDAINNDERNALVVRAYTELCVHEGRSTLVFAATVEHAEALVQAFKRAGVNAGAVFGKTSADERARTLEALSSGAIQVVVNVGVLTEGFDEPSIRAIILARPTRSPLLYTQIVGRGTRLLEGKRDCLVIDITDIAGQKKPLGLPTLLGLPPEFDLEGQDLVEAAKKFWELEEKSPTEAARVKSLADIEFAWERIDIFAPPPVSEVVKEHSRFVWAEVGEDSFYLNVSTGERLHITRNTLGNYECALSKLGAKDNAWDHTPLGNCETLREAFSRSDSWVQRNRSSNLALLEHDRVWRTDPPTPKQIKVLHKFGIPVTGDLTKGEASAIIDKLFAENPKPSKPLWLQKKINAQKHKGRF